MTKPPSDSSFTTDVARLYEATLVPLIFEPYADDLAERAKALESAPGPLWRRADRGPDQRIRRGRHLTVGLQYPRSRSTTFSIRSPAT